MPRFLLATAIIIAAATLFLALLIPAKAETGTASWYGSESGSRRADGHRFHPNTVSCAHKTIPLRTWIRVTDLDTRRSVVCQVLDRGPYIGGRIVDLSRGAARKLGILGRGTARVHVNIVRQR